MFWLFILCGFVVVGLGMFASGVHDENEDLQVIGAGLFFSGLLLMWLWATYSGLALVAAILGLIALTISVFEVTCDELYTTLFAIVVGSLFFITCVNLREETIEQTEAPTETPTEEIAPLEPKYVVDGEYIIISSNVFSIDEVTCQTITMEDDTIGQKTLCTDISTGVATMYDTPFEIVSGDMLLSRLLEEKMNS